MDARDIEGKVLECKQFLEVLKTRLQRALARENEVKDEITEYTALGRRLQELAAAKKPGPIVELCDLGHEKVFCRATVEDTSYIYVHVGMGFHVELSLTEALSFTEKRLSFLRQDVHRRQTIQTDKVKQHIRASEMMLDGLSAELRMRQRGI